ncbi:Rha family transcriptional regulator [Paucilactobacillus nenjiangensis]|jgi:phage regulator Rha-like protein|uniref:Rha family transcriptional regulator n=1 Tax=Paucilactobacillus nenjiangensis TaxID=1296540 RepID=UPI003BB1BDC2
MDIVTTESFSLHDEPYTTAETIAKYSGNELKSINRLITTHKSDLEEFGVLRFQIAKPLKGSQGGRPTKIYQLNEEQATLLITYLDNTEQVRKFKIELVHEFFAMKKDLLARNLARDYGKKFRRLMTDAIQESTVIGDEWYNYSNFTKLVYSSALGQSLPKLRKARNVDKKAVSRDFLNDMELQAISKREDQIAVLIDLGMDYKQIKAVLDQKGVIYQTTLELPVKAVI